MVSIDALRGLVMFTMIFVNDLAGAPREIVPDWMVHFSERHENGSGMTFVDLVFPAFLFIVGLSIPFSLEKRGSLVIKLGHILFRTLILLAIGILMVNGEEGASNSWYVRMFAFAILAACQIGPKPGTPGKAAWQIANLGLRLLGYAGLLFCALTLKHHDQAMLTLSPFRLHTSWYGILGLIGWAYLAAAMLFVVFRTHSTALLGCVALMTSFYAADRHGFFNHFWPAQFVDFGGTLGSQAAITVAGLLLSTILIRPETASPVARTKFTVLFIAGFALAACLTTSLYGISKNAATPAWCFWADAITAAMWLIFYLICDVKPVAWLSRPLALAGQNVLLAYLLSEMFPSVLEAVHLGDWYSGLAAHSLLAAVVRSATCGVLILLVTVGLNRVGFRLRL
jgi:predicted acyltransferase